MPMPRLARSDTTPSPRRLGSARSPATASGSAKTASRSMGSRGRVVVAPEAAGVRKGAAVGEAADVREANGVGETAGEAALSLGLVTAVHPASMDMHKPTATRIRMTGLTPRPTFAGCRLDRIQDHADPIEVGVAIALCVSGKQGDRERSGPEWHPLCGTS